MKKICPYCKRTGEVGEVCQGCGYILTMNDQTVPEPEPAPEPDHAQTTRTKTVHSQTTYTKTQSTEAQDQFVDLTKQFQTLVNDIQSQPMHTGSIFSQMQNTQSPPPQEPPAGNRVLSVFGWFMSVPLIFAGLAFFGVMFTSADYGVPPVLMGYVACILILWGFLFLSFTQQWCKKFRKYIVFAIVACIVGMLIIASLS